MSDKLGSTQAFSVKTQENREQLKSGAPTQVTLTRETTVRRPDRLYFKTIGGVENEGWYDGVGLTLVIHKEKVYGQARMPETLDKALDALNERYGISTPLGDFLYSSPAKALLSDTTTGGWVARESIDGQPVDHVAFKEKGVNWELWVPATGDPLPRKGIVNFTDDKRLRKVEVTFSDWNLAPQIADNTFKPTVPKDYEGIAIVQRAGVLRNMPEDQPEPVGTTAPAKPGPKGK